MKKLIHILLCCILLFGIGACTQEKGATTAEETLLSFLQACQEGKIEELSNYADDSVQQYYNAIPTGLFGDAYANLDDTLKEKIETYIKASISANYQSYEITEREQLNDTTYRFTVRVHGVNSENLYSDDAFLTYMASKPQEDIHSLTPEQLSSYFIEETITFLTTRLDEAIQQENFVDSYEIFTVIKQDNTWKVTF